MHMPVILGCLVSVLLCVLLLFMRRALFWYELKKYKKYIALATAPSIIELKNKCWYEGISVCSRLWLEHNGLLRKGNGGPSWYEIDKYRIESHVGTSPYTLNRGQRNTNEVERRRQNSFKISFDIGIEDGLEVADAVHKGLERYLISERGAVSANNSVKVSDKYLAKADYRKMAGWGYFEDFEWSRYNNPSHYLLYCLDVIERNGLPCLLLTDGEGSLRKKKDDLYRDCVFGFLSYPLRGIKMKEALRFKGRMLLVDGVQKDDAFTWYCWQDVEMIRRGIAPYVTVPVDKWFNPTTDWKDPDNKHIACVIKDIERMHNRYSKRYGSFWTKKDTMIRIGYVRGWKPEDLPEEMRISEQTAEYWSEKKDILIPNLDIYRIRVTPFTFDGVVSFSDYVKYGCPVYDFSMYGCRLSGRYNRSRHMVERGQMVDEQWQDRTCFEDLYAVKVTEEQLSNVEDLQRKE